MTEEEAKEIIDKIIQQYREAFEMLEEYDKKTANPSQIKRD